MPALRPVNDTAPDPTSAGPRPGGVEHDFTAAEIGAIAHLYRGEVYRSTLWRTRLDNTTNWAVVTTGIAFSISFATPEASGLPLLLTSLLVAVFILFEARRYRYFNVWRARARHMETQFYAPMLRGESITRDKDWHMVLARDYCEPKHHISLLRALGRRLRRNYSWLLLVQAAAYGGKIATHPGPLTSFGELAERAALGPLSGWLILAIGVGFHGGWIGVAFYTWHKDRQAHASRKERVAMG